ncbi:MAG: hypothetical protein IJ008_00120 [Clostridia bacterium]|nr:hypothetical protein [Clostridia bacterium]
MVYYILKKDKLKYKLADEYFSEKEGAKGITLRRPPRSYYGTFTLGAFESSRVARAARRKLMNNPQLEGKESDFTMDYRIVVKEEIPVNKKDNKKAKLYNSTKDFVKDYTLGK